MLWSVWLGVELAPQPNKSHPSWVQQPSPHCCYVMHSCSAEIVSLRHMQSVHGLFSFSIHIVSMDVKS